MIKFHSKNENVTHKFHSKNKDFNPEMKQFNLQMIPLSLQIKRIHLRMVYFHSENDFRRMNNGKFKLEWERCTPLPFVVLSWKFASLILLPPAVITPLCSPTKQEIPITPPTAYSPSWFLGGESTSIFSLPSAVLSLCVSWVKYQTWWFTSEQWNSL